jgi:hypothetical protein
MSNHIPETLKLDYEKTLAAIDKYDGHIQEIKKWSITVCGGVMAFGVKEQSWPITTLTAFLAASFWFVALICKSYLIAARAHAMKLEKLIDEGGELKQPYGFGLVSGPSRLSLWETAFHPIAQHISIFYFLIVVVTILADCYLACLCCQK